jgi:GT2 family glycosyltransferase
MRQVTASIVSHGQGPLLFQLLADLGRLAPPELAHVIVTLNVAEEWTPPPLVAHAPVTVIRNPQALGFAANHNQAFKQCTTPLFAVLNPDLRLPTDPFPALMDAMARPGCGLAVPWQVDGSGAAEDFCRQLLTPLDLLRRGLRKRLGRPAVLTPPARLDWVAGSFLLLRSEAFRAADGFNARYRLYCEDADLCLRLQLQGESIAVVREATVVHAAQRASGRKLRYLYWHLASFARHWTSAAFWRYRRLRAARAAAG